jgi:hypothetical protein
MYALVDHLCYVGNETDTQQWPQHTTLMDSTQKKRHQQLHAIDHHSLIYLSISVFYMIGFDFH